MKGLTKQEANLATKQIVREVGEQMSPMYSKSLSERMKFVEDIQVKYLEQIQTLQDYYLTSNMNRFENKGAVDALDGLLEKLTNLILFANPEDVVVDGKEFTAEDQRADKKERPYTTESNQMAVMSSRESLNLDAYLEYSDTNESNTTTLYSDKDIKINMAMVKKHVEEKAEAKEIIDNYLYTGQKVRQIVEDYDNSNENEQFRFVDRLKHPKLPFRIENIVSTGAMPRDKFVEIQANLDSPEYKHYDKSLFHNYRLECAGDIIWGVDLKEKVEVQDNKYIANIKKAVGYTKNNCSQLDQDAIAVYKTLTTMVFFKKVASPAFKADRFKMDFTDEMAVRNLIRLGFFTGISDNFDSTVDELLRVKTACRLNENEEKVFSVYFNGKCNGDKLCKEYDDASFTKNVMTHKLASERLGIPERQVKKQIDAIALKLVNKYKEVYEDKYHFMEVEKGEYKECASCGKIKLTVKFNVDNKTRDGLKNICKQCRKEKK